MAFSLEDGATTEWTTFTVSRPYVLMYYWLDDYVEDEEWSLVIEPGNVWTPVA